MHIGCWVGRLDFKRDKQIECFLGLVIPEFCSTNRRTELNESNVFVVSCIGDTNTSVQRQEANVLLFLETVVMSKMIFQRRGDVLGGLVKPLVAFLGSLVFSGLCVLLDLCPQAFVRRSHLSRDATRHLGGKTELLTKVCNRLSSVVCLMKKLSCTYTRNKRNAPSSPCLESKGILVRFGEQEESSLPRSLRR